MGLWALQALQTQGTDQYPDLIYSCLPGHIPRDLEDRLLGGDKAAALAIEMFCYRVAKYVASYTVPLGR